ncbi:MAG TPA: hypothetical protein H9763_11235 [Candidatus Eisenbergiella merdigallinarum]|uniref:Alternate signal-mediated exported protein, CPF_0494 family n=1 Tax=Candidatus Eisenbergiella merdigallinarum TaxID=2838552 RepID=A0A9D2MT79_9FIRM|nr:hypothetical protein [Candidatus Eisenbergiella merdigallinarum]
MDRGKRQNKSRRRRQGRRFNRRAGMLILSFLLIAAAVIGGTMAWLNDETAPLVNTFIPSTVDTEITEEFDGHKKENVNVTNIGDTEAYIRVKLVTYRVDGEGNHIGGTAEIPGFTPGEGWVEYNGHYYYTLPVEPGESPADALIDSIELKKYNDADGGRQVIEVMAEAIQSRPAAAVGEAWGVSIAPDSVTEYTAGATE